MNKKNLIFLTLLIGVLMVSVVSAGITGYLTRGTAIQDSGYKATLQKVEGTTAVVAVTTSGGDTQIVRVPEGEAVQVGEAKISATDLTRGTLFRRAGAEVGIEVVPVTLKPEKSSSVSCNLGTSCYESILDMLNNATVTSFMNLGGMGIGDTCDNLCGNTNTIYKKCVTASFEEYGHIGSQRATFYAGDIPCNYPMYNSSFGGTTTYTCRCI